MADEEKVTESRPVPPVVVTVTGTGDGSRLPCKGVAETVGQHLPNIIYNVVTPIAMIAVRGVKGFMVSFMSLITAGPATGIITFTDASQLVAKCAILSVIAGVVAGGWAFLEVLTKLDQKFPTWTA